MRVGVDEGKRRTFKLQVTLLLRSFSHCFQLCLSSPSHQHQEIRELSPVLCNPLEWQVPPNSMHLATIRFALGRGSFILCQ